MSVKCWPACSCFVCVFVGQLLSFHMGLFQMGKTATVLIAMLLMVALVDALSYGARRWMTR